MDNNLPVWVYALLELLKVGETFGRWCSDRRHWLVEDYCRCEICKEFKRGYYQKLREKTHERS
jgi:hypothetical protein